MRVHVHVRMPRNVAEVQLFRKGVFTMRAGVEDPVAAQCPATVMPLCLVKQDWCVALRGHSGGGRVLYQTTPRVPSNMPLLHLPSQISSHQPARVVKS